MLARHRYGRDYSPPPLPAVGDVLLTPEGRGGEVHRLEGSPPRALLWMHGRLERRKCRVLRYPGGARIVASPAAGGWGWDPGLIVGERAVRIAIAATASLIVVGTACALWWSL